jgi:autotransporter strand-loop-strand O-heptosyltransferase
MVYIKFNYKTTLPKEANAPSVIIGGDLLLEFDVTFYVVKSDGLEKIKSVKCKTGEIAYSNTVQWYMDWYITVHHNGELIAENKFNPENRPIFIKLDAYALGDNIAWIPYMNEFVKKNNCILICSTFYNSLFKDIYPNILFVEPNTNIDNIYSQYYIGASNDGNKKYSPVIVDNIPLQYVAPSVLGLPMVEVRPELEKQLQTIKYDKKYVCISEFGSHEKKHWKYDGGWQQVVDYLNSINYDVLVISKEPTKLKNIIDLTGDKPIISRAQILKDCEFFMGVSSGLSWLSWGVGAHTFLISDVTQMNHEFQSNVTRISANENLTNVDYDAPFVTKPETIIESIKKYLETKS